MRCVSVKSAATAEWLNSITEGMNMNCLLNGIHNPLIIRIQKSTDFLFIAVSIICCTKSSIPELIK
jgi:hypothetical protein